MTILSFVEYKQHLQEGAISNEIRDELEKLQLHWLENRDKYLAKGMYAITSRPFDKALSKGILLVGVNPAVNQQNFDDDLSVLDQDVMNALYDKKTKTWANTLNNKLERRRVNTDISHFMTTEYITKDKNGANKKRPSDVSTNGSWYYHAAFNKFLENLGLEEMKSKISDVNVIPFGSRSINELTPEIWKMCMPWFLKYLKITKPKLIFTTFGVLDYLKTYLPYKKQDLLNSSYNLHGKTKKGMRLIQTGYLGGIPVVAMPHPSGAWGIKPHHDKTVDEEAENIRNMIYFIMNNKLPPVKDSPFVAPIVDNILKQKDKAKKLLLSDEEIQKLLSKYRADIDTGDIEDFVIKLRDVTEEEGQDKVQKIIKTHTGK